MKQLKPKSLFGVSTIVLCAIVGCLNAGWWQTFGGTNIDWGSCVQQTSDGGYIVTGFTYSFGTPGVGDIWLIKLDSLGGSEWTKTYGEGGGEVVRESSDGGYIIVGTKLIKTDSNGDTMWTRPYTSWCAQQTNDGGYILTGRNGLNLELMKLNENGDSVWVRLYKKGNAGNGGRYVEQTSDGGYIITGVAIDTLNEDVYKASIWLLRTDANGDTLWTKTHGGEEWDITARGNCVRQTLDGGYIIAGLLDDPANRWYCLIKTDSAGNIEWKSIEDGELYCVEQTLDGGYIAVGATETATLATSVTPTGGNLWLIKTDENGDTVWTREYGGESTDAGRYVQPTSDSGYVVVGYTTSFGAGSYDLYLLKTDSLGLLSVTEDGAPVLEKSWQVLSSVGPYITLMYSESPQGFSASVFDVTGRKVDDLRSSNQSGVITWGMGYSPGVYFIKDNNLNQTTTSKVVLVK